MRAPAGKLNEIIVAAVAANGVIGAAGKIPWHCPEDLRLFRKLTLGGVVIMGRKTFQSIGCPLDGRYNIVISSTLQGGGGITVVPSFAAAVAAALEFGGTIFYCGGERVYAQALGRADAIALSRMRADAVGDVFFPEIDPRIWQVVSREEFADFTFLCYRRLACTG